MLFDRFWKEGYILKKSPCPGEDRGGVLFRRTMGVEILPNEEA